MSISNKYGRTYHYPFSPGTTSDDRINYDYWSDMQLISKLVHTEKVDGENNCLSRYGVFARSHAAPTVSPWSKKIRDYCDLIKNDLGDLEIFGENLYAVHSIVYPKIDEHFYVIRVRLHDVWLSWEETKFYANMLGLPTVPVIKFFDTPTNQKDFEAEILEIVKGESVFGSLDAITGKPCSMEGIVTCSTAEYPVSEFDKMVYKWVRKGHVKTDEHWTRNWKRAKLKWESSDYVEYK